MDHIICTSGGQDWWVSDVMNRTEVYVLQKETLL